MVILGWLLLDYDDTCTMCGTLALQYINVCSVVTLGTPGQQHINVDGGGVVCGNYLVGDTWWLLQILFFVVEHLGHLLVYCRVGPLVL